MNDFEKYEFDRQGYLVIKAMLTPEEVASLSGAVDELESDALEHVDEPPRKALFWGGESHFNEAKGYFVHGSNQKGATLLVEDFWNSSSAFDFLVNHPRTLDYVNAAVQPRATINNSEIRIRYRGNQSKSHGGSRKENQKYSYRVNQSGIDCMMVRMIYFIHDVSNEQGAFSVAPGSHKTNFPCPYENDPDVEPGMIGLEVKSGDAIFFTEHLRHGGLTNKSEQVRKTIHVGYGPYWMMSQNISTMDEPPFLTDATRARYTSEQNLLFRAWPIKE
ncbi:MAG: phytanoyl-CoA dioxygenase family protein [Planctomycetota bacterium]|nr:phytanoyl-CoA dioxygenase family protein [Planctomycetota bacterium]MDA1141965.1 phytanoyl-CoA dioxygenase family protein [Planctomycetota bacterium]